MCLINFKQFYRACFFAFFIFSFSSTSFSASSSLESVIVEHQKQIDQKKKKLDSIYREKKSLDAELLSLEKSIKIQEQQIESDKKKLDELFDKDDKVQVQYEEVLAKKVLTEEVERETLRLLWELTAKEQLFDNKSKANLEVLNREYTWSKYLLNALELYRQDLVKQEKLLAKLVGKRKKLSEDLNKSLLRLEKNKSVLLEKRIAFDKRLLELSKSEAANSKELSSLIKEAEQLKVQLKKESGSLEGRKGKLPWPLKGVVAKRFSPSSKNRYSGIGIKVAEGTLVRAISSGKVVHNSVLRGFGKVVILQHGEDFYSLYAYLSDSPLSVGLSVLESDVIGKSGYYPLLNSGGLYFELRFKTKAVNPEQWLLAL